MRRFSNSSRKRQIGLLVSLHKSLQRIDTLLLRHLADIVNGTRHLVVGAPYGRTRRPGLLSQSHAVHRITSRTLHGRDVESKPVLRLERAANMKPGVTATLMTRHARTLVGLADFANFAIPITGNETETFSRLELLGGPELDLRGPYRTHHMYPVVAHCSLQRFSRTDRLTNSLLSLAVELDRLLDHLLLEPFLLPIPISLLFMRDPRRLHQLVFRPSHRAQNTFVTRRNHRTAIVRAHITQPFDAVARGADTIAITMYRQATVAT